MHRCDGLAVALRDVCRGLLPLCLILALFVPVAARAETALPIGEQLLRSVVQVHARVTAGARTARTLGTARAGNGVVIGADGLVLTIGYLIMESEELVVIDQQGNAHPAYFVAYDHRTGFGLLRTAVPLPVAAASLGRSADLGERSLVLAAASGGVGQARVSMVVSRRSFAGPWEYLLDRAIYTVPPFPSFGGAALFDADGKLVGIGSLAVGDAPGTGDGPPGNLFVPIDLLKPILADLLAFGRSTEPPKPWLGIYPAEAGGALLVSRVARDSPAQAAGIRRGDILLGVGETPVREMEAFFREVWALGPAGVRVPLRILQDGTVRDVTLTSRDRHGWLKLKRDY